MGSTHCVIRGVKEVMSDKYRIGPFCSVFQAELTAIKKSIEYLKRKTESETQTSTLKVRINSDSQSAIAAIKQLNNFHPIVYNIKYLNKSLKSKVVLHFQLVKGYSEIPGKERADSLAKEAADLSLSESIYNFFPLSFTKRHFSAVTMNEWEKRWTSTTKASQTKIFFQQLVIGLVLT